MAVAAATPAASRAVPARTRGSRLERVPDGSSRRAADASADEMRGARLSWTATLPRAARAAIQERARPARGRAQPIAPAAPRPAVMAARQVTGPAPPAFRDGC